MKLRFVVILALLLSACAETPVSPIPYPNWIRVSGKEAGCVSFAPKKNELVDLNVKLKPEFEQILAAQLEPALAKLPRCWYETPEGSIRLFVGNFCGNSTDVYFEPGSPDWTLSKSEDIYANCRTTH